MKKALILGGAVIAGNWIAERFVLKATADGPGFVAVAPGFGLDDVARAAVIVGTAHLLTIIAGKV